VKSLQYYDFQFRHRINLQEYLGAHYSLEFKNNQGKLLCTNDPNLSIHIDGPYENTWVQADRDAVEKNGHGSLLKYGTILNWESIKHDCSLVEAVSIVSKNRAELSDYKSQRYKKLESLFRKVALRFRYSRTPEVSEYLESRGLDYSLYAKDFDIGSPASYDILLHDLKSPKSSANEIEELLGELYITKDPRTYEYLPFTQAVVVPVFDRNSDFVGFHGKRINKSGSRGFFKTGFLKDQAAEILYGEEKPEIRETITSKKQLILTKGIFDFFACYQEDFKQIFATLHKGVSVQQFEQILQYPVSEIIVGFSEHKERETVLALMEKSLRQIDVLEIQDGRDIDEISTSGERLSDILQGAFQKVEETEAGKIAAAIKLKKSKMDLLTETGHTFLVTTDELIQMIQCSKRSPVKIKQWLKQQSATNSTEVLNRAYIRIPKTFTKDSVLDVFGAEIRTLLHLMSKTKGGQNPINYKQSTLCADLGLSQAVLIDHLKKLKASGYLMWTKKKKKRQVVFRYYPSLVQY